MTSSLRSAAAKLRWLPAAPCVALNGADVTAFVNLTEVSLRFNC